MPQTGSVIVELTARQGDRTVHNRDILFIKGENGYANREQMLAFAPCFKELALNS